MMHDNLTLNGLPRALARDGWWLGPEGDLPDTPAQPGHTTQGRARVPGFLALVVLADLLFWRQGLGLSVAVFGLAIFAVAVWPQRDGRVRVALGVLVLGLLPVAEHVQPLSLAFAALGLAGAAAIAFLPGADAAGLMMAALRYLARVPLGGFIAAMQLVLDRAPVAPAMVQPGRIARFLRGWALPMGGTAVFAALLMQANPIIEQLLSLDVDGALLLNRALFWLGMALLIWPLLLPPRPIAMPLQRRSGRVMPGVNAPSVLRGLVLFNLLIALQTGLDLSILLGGARLPAGMSYASYAHRGAYPLLVTAVLAGVFALAARPFLAEHRLIRPLMLVWLGQNVALCLAALLRLDLYVQAYGLTYLRVHAAIWMVLVAVGLALCLWQTLRGLPNGWLLRRVAGLGVLVLYMGCFVNFAAVIARHNLSLVETDMAYTCALGPTAAAVFADSAARSPQRPMALPRGCDISPPQIDGWRDWGFRNWRVARYVADQESQRFAR